ncbi:MAG TPA: heat-inducible transcriptional repressor HrcA [Myxococcales bacterium]|nr:heat-inducible transcriptional repressor HrcA [Myxococcales bacterium]
MTEQLGEREQEVLRAVVREYISTGGPVGSSQLARDFEVSSATLRNVLVDLEELGFLEKPHTSAGRVPTDRGYRFFVDTLMKLRDPEPKDRELIEHGILGAPRHGAAEETAQDASKVLHFLSHHAAVVVTPRPALSVFRQIEFVRLRENRILAVLVSESGQVQNKVFTADFPVSLEDLVRCSNYLNDLLRRVPLEDARQRIQTELEQEKALYDTLSAKALRLGIAAIDLPDVEKVVIEGTGSFLDAPEFSLQRMRALFKALEEKHKLLMLLDRVQRAKELQIFIGTESEFSSAGEVSVIASPYGASGQVLGAVGVIGPTRMDYQRVIPLVNFTAQVLSRVLETD